MSKTDDVAALEKAISKKYGDVAVKNPKSGWDEDKEQEYQEQTKILQKRQKKAEDEQDKVEVDGFFLSKKLLTREKESRTCPECNTYSFKNIFYIIKCEINKRSTITKTTQMNTCLT